MGEEKRRTTFSVLFYIKKQKLLKNGEAPICMRITVNKQKAEIMIKQSIPAKVQRSLLEVYAEHNEKCRGLIGKEYSPATVEKFETSIKHLREFIRSQYHREDLLLNEVNGQFIRDFEYWLKTMMGCQNNSALKHLKNLKKVIRIALANEWMTKDPFYGIHFKMDEVNIEFFTKEELEVLLNKEFSIKRLEQVRDVFAFCCFSGMAFSDVSTSLTGNIWSEAITVRYGFGRRDRKRSRCAISPFSLLPKG